MECGAVWYMSHDMGNSCKSVTSKLYFTKAPSKTILNADCVLHVHVYTPEKVTYHVDVVCQQQLVELCAVGQDVTCSERPDLVLHRAASEGVCMCECACVCVCVT